MSTSKIKKMYPLYLIYSVKKGVFTLKPTKKQKSERQFLKEFSTLKEAKNWLNSVTPLRNIRIFIHDNVKQGFSDVIDLFSG